MGDENDSLENAAHADSIADLLRDAQARLRVEDYAGALELYDAAVSLDPERIELEGYIDLLRSRLVKIYRQRIGDGSQIPKLLLPPDRISRFNLPADAGFMLSLIDANTSFDELLSVSGMGPFDALRIFASLLDAGIVGVST